MKPTRTLLAGPVAAVIFAATVLLLPLGIPGYSSVHQTVSEIGMVGSPMRVPFTVLVCLVALLLLVFGLALHTAARDAGQSSLAGYLTICAANSVRGCSRAALALRGFLPVVRGDRGDVVRRWTPQDARGHRRHPGGLSPLRICAGGWRGGRWPRADCRR